MFNREVVLLKLKRRALVSVVRVESGEEIRAMKSLADRDDVEFCELDVYQRRLFFPSDPLVTNQWHHAKIGSYSAWDAGLGRTNINIAIVDAPFQMDHPDLAGNVLPGWDVVSSVPVLSSSGIDHSTLGAGLAAAVINDHLGVAGAGNCGILPININGAISEMYNAVIWAADHGLRVVNISWTGGDSATLNAAGTYLKTNAFGVLVMAGGNFPGDVDPNANQPDIWCVSMTDSADLVRSESGLHIDFAAPGYQVLSTTINSNYAYCSGTSFSAPLLSGVVAVLFSLNPTLRPDDVASILRGTAADLGQPGWDNFYGWGRIDFGRAVSAATATLPRITGTKIRNGQIVLTTTYDPSLNYQLLTTTSPVSDYWQALNNVSMQTNSPNELEFVIGFPSAPTAFYRLEAYRP